MALLGISRNATGQERHTRDDAVRLVRRAADYLRSHPRSEALALFSDPSGPFRDGDLYLYVLDAEDGQLTMLAHGANHGLLGMPQTQIVDAEGKDFNAETVELVKARGEGWIHYKWSNPMTRKIAPKTTFVELVDGLIVGAGVYD